MLPASCRHYPRVVLRDDGGTRVSLSHYCPTAASLLVSKGELRVMLAPPGLVVDEPVEGLDARSALPPLIRPEMLADRDGYCAWETACVATLERHTDATGALGVIGLATEVLRQWTPSAGPLVDAVAGAFVTAEQTWSERPVPYARVGGQIVATLATTAPRIPEKPCEQLTADMERAISNYLAARAFGNWLCYHGRGFRTIVAWLHACHDVVRAFAGSQATATVDIVSAIRSADFLMMHTIDSQAFADAAVSIERERLP
ncbi:hypothetical protein BH18ACI5_BH18ACI5_01110 [soil metagenome]